MHSKPLAIYIHWPFCKSKCPYCDFNSHVRDSVAQEDWKTALLKETSYFHTLLPERRITSIFFGGGTPSLMPPATVEALLSHIGTLWEMDEECEITLEANPTSVEIANFKQLRAAGVNRVSVGVQALNADDLSFLGRTHNPAEAITAIAAARDIFDRYSFDLIYARPGQTLTGWKQELTEAFKLAGGHISLYQLTIEPGTAFYHAYNKGEFVLPEDDLATALYDLTTDMLAAHGLARYEVSNYAKPGQESRHNLAYWRYEDYIGIGPGAHGRIRFADGTRIAAQAVKHPETWLETVKKQGHAITTQDVLSESEQVDECVMMGLRLKEGISYTGFEERIGKPLRSVIPEQRLAPLIQQRLLEVDATGIRATDQGMMLLNQVTSALLV